MLTKVTGCFRDFKANNSGKNKARCRKEREKKKEKKYAKRLIISL